MAQDDKGMKIEGVNGLEESDGMLEEGGERWNEKIT